MGFQEDIEAARLQRDSGRRESAEAEQQRQQEARSQIPLLRSRLSDVVQGLKNSGVPLTPTGEVVESYKDRGGHRYEVRRDGPEGWFLVGPQLWLGVDAQIYEVEAARTEESGPIDKLLDNAFGRNRRPTTRRQGFKPVDLVQAWTNNHRCLSSAHPSVGFYRATSAGGETFCINYEHAVRDGAMKLALDGAR